MSTDAVIVDVIRTPSGRGKPGGALSGIHPADLLAGVLSELVRRNDLDPALVDDVIGGCVTQIGEQSTNITRTAVLSAGFPDSVPAVTVDRQCGSSQQAAAFAAQGVLAGAYDVVIACGVESMSRVPMLSNRAGQSTSGALLRAPIPGRPGQPGRVRRADRRPVGVQPGGTRRVLCAVARARGRGSRIRSLRQRARTGRRAGQRRA